MYYLEHLPQGTAKNCTPTGASHTDISVREDIAWHNLVESLRPADIEQLYRGETMLLRADDDTLPVRTRALFKQAGVCSALLAPLSGEGSFTGYSGSIIACRNACRGPIGSRSPSGRRRRLALALEREATACALSDEKERLLGHAGLGHGRGNHDRSTRQHRADEPRGRGIDRPFVGRVARTTDRRHIQRGGRSNPRTLPGRSCRRPVARDATDDREHNQQVWLWTRAGDRLRIAKGSCHRVRRTPREPSARSVFSATSPSRRK